MVGGLYADKYRGAAGHTRQWTGVTHNNGSETQRQVYCPCLAKEIHIMCMRVSVYACLCVDVYTNYASLRPVEKKVPTYDFMRSRTRPQPRHTRPVCSPVHPSTTSNHCPFVLSCKRNENKFVRVYETIWHPSTVTIPSLTTLTVQCVEFDSFSPSVHGRLSDGRSTGAVEDVSGVKDGLSGADGARTSARWGCPRGPPSLTGSSVSAEVSLIRSAVNSAAISTNDWPVSRSHVSTCFNYWSGEWCFCFGWSSTSCLTQKSFRSSGYRDESSPTCRGATPVGRTFLSLSLSQSHRCGCGSVLVAP